MESHGFAGANRGWLRLGSAISLAGCCLGMPLTSSQVQAAQAKQGRRARGAQYRQVDRRTRDGQVPYYRATNLLATFTGRRRQADRRGLVYASFGYGSSAPSPRGGTSRWLPRWGPCTCDDTALPRPACTTCGRIAHSIPDGSAHSGRLGVIYSFRFADPNSFVRDASALVRTWNSSDTVSSRATEIGVQVLKALGSDEHS